MIIKNKIFLGVAISAVCIGFLLFLVDFSLVWKTICRLNPSDLWIIGFLYLISFLIRTKRWTTLSSAGFQLPFRTAFEGLTYGYVVNQILPAKLGEVFRAEYVVRKGISNRSAVIGSIVVERLFDILVLTCFLGLSIISSDVLQHLFSKKFLLIVLLLLFIFSFLLVVLFVSQKKRNVFHLLRDKFKLNIENIVTRFSETFYVFKSPVLCITVLIQTVMIWSITGGIFYVLTTNLSLTIPWYGYFFIVSAGTFGMIIPSTSGNVGVYHLVAMSSLMVFGVSREDALAFAILAHALDLASNLSMGAGVYLNSILQSLFK